MVDVVEGTINIDFDVVAVAIALIAIIIAWLGHHYRLKEIEKENDRKFFIDMRTALIDYLSFFRKEIMLFRGLLDNLKHLHSTGQLNKEEISSVTGLIASFRMQDLDIDNIARKMETFNYYWEVELEYFHGKLEEFNQDFKELTLEIMGFSLDLQNINDDNLPETGKKIDDLITKVNELDTKLHTVRTIGHLELGVEYLTEKPKNKVLLEKVKERLKEVIEDDKNI